MEGAGISIEGVGISIEGTRDLSQVMSIEGLRESIEGTRGSSGGDAESMQRSWMFEVDGMRMWIWPVIQSINGLKQRSQEYPRTMSQGESRDVM